MTHNVNENVVSALLVGEYKSDRLLAQEIFRLAGWRLFEARNRRSAMECLERNPVQVVLAQSDLPNWSWQNVLRDLRCMRRPPQLVVTSPTADDRLWAEVLNIGGYDVLLAEPFEADELRRVVASASRHFDVPPGLARLTSAEASSAA